MKTFTGSRRWAEAWAAKLQHLVGTPSDGTGAPIVAIEVRRHRDALFARSVVKIWRYPSGNEGMAYLNLPEAFP